jgi:hypothetical protein
MAKPYEAAFLVGTRVRVRNLDRLKRFAEEWKHHHPLTEDQLKYADTEATVQEVGYYHGGDVLYALDGIPGKWHPQCLSRV